MENAPINSPTTIAGLSVNRLRKTASLPDYDHLNPNQNNKNTLVTAVLSTRDVESTLMTTPKSPVPTSEEYLQSKSKISSEICLLIFADFDALE